MNITDDGSKLTDVVARKQACNMRELSHMGIPPMFISQHTVANANNSMTFTAKPYASNLNFGAAVGRDDKDIASQPVTVTFSFVDVDTWNAMYASALAFFSNCVSETLRKLPVTVFMDIVRMNASIKASADVAKFFMALEYAKDRFTRVWARTSVLPSGVHGYIALVLRAGRMFTKSFQFQICSKPSRIVFDATRMRWQDIHERNNHANTNNPMGQLVRNTVSKVLIVPKASVEHPSYSEEDRENAFLTNELLKVCTVGHLTNRTRKESREFVYETSSVRKGNGNVGFFVHMGRPDGQRLERQSTRMTDEKNWPLIRISAESQTPEDIVKSLAEMSYDDLFRLFSGMESIYANMLLLAVRLRMVPESSKKARRSILNIANTEYSMDEEGRVYPKPSIWWDFKSLSLSRMLATADSLREYKNMLVCGPVRHITVGFRFSLRLPYTLAAPSGTKKTFRHILMTGRSIEVSGTRLSGIDVVWNNILKNGLLPMLTSATNDDEDALTSSDIQAFFQNYTPGRAQIRDDGRMVGNENESRVVLGSYFCEDGIDLRYPFKRLPAEEEISMHDAARREIIRVTPSKLRTLTSITIITHDRHGCVRKRKHKSVYNMGGTVGSHIANRLGSLATERLEQLGHRLLFLENVNRRDSAINQDGTLHFRNEDTGRTVCLHVRQHNHHFRLADISDLKDLEMGEYHELAGDQQVARGRVLRVTDHTYDLRSHGGGTFYGVVYCPPPQQTETINVVGWEEAVRMLRDRKIEWFRKHDGPNIIKSAFEKDFVRSPEGQVLRRECPLDLDTCMLREDIEFLPRNFIDGKILHCMLDIQTLNNNFPSAMSIHARRIGFDLNARYRCGPDNHLSHNPRELTCAQMLGIKKAPPPLAEQQTPVTLEQSVEESREVSSGVFPDWLLGKSVFRSLSWGELESTISSRMKLYAGHLCKKTFKKIRLCGTSRIVPSTHTIARPHLNINVAWQQKWQEPTADRFPEKEWFGRYVGDPSSLSGDEAKLFQEMTRSTNVPKRAEWTVKRVWGSGTTEILPEYAKLRQIRMIWLNGAEHMGPLHFFLDLQSMMTYMLHALRTKFNMHGHLMSKGVNVDGIRDGLQSYSETEGIPDSVREANLLKIRSVDRLLAIDADPILRWNDPVNTCGMRGKSEVHAKTMLKRLADRGASNWAFMWKKKKEVKRKRKRKDTDSTTETSAEKKRRSSSEWIQCPHCMGFKCAQCGHTGKKRIRIEEDSGITEIVSQTPFEAYKAKGGEVIELD